MKQNNHKNPQLNEPRMRTKYMSSKRKGNDRKFIKNADNYQDLDEAFRNFFIRRGMTPPKVSSHAIEGMLVDKEQTR